MKLAFASLSLSLLLPLVGARGTSKLPVSPGPDQEESLCKVWVCESPEGMWSNASVCEANCDFACDVAFVC